MMSAAQVLFFLLFLLLVLLAAASSASIRLFLLQLVLSGILKRNRPNSDKKSPSGLTWSQRNASEAACSFVSHTPTNPSIPPGQTDQASKTVESFRLLSDHISFHSADLCFKGVEPVGHTSIRRNISTLAFVAACPARFDLRDVASHCDRVSRQRVPTRS